MFKKDLRADVLVGSFFVRILTRWEMGEVVKWIRTDDVFETGRFQRV